MLVPVELARRGIDYRVHDLLRSIDAWLPDGWDDKVVGWGQLALGAMMLPTLIDPRSTVLLMSSLPTALILLSFVPAFHKRGMDRSKYTSLFTALVWLGIAILRHP